MGERERSEGGTAEEKRDPARDHGAGWQVPAESHVGGRTAQARAQVYVCWISEYGLTLDTQVTGPKTPQSLRVLQLVVSSNHESTWGPTMGSDATRSQDTGESLKQVLYFLPSPHRYNYSLQPPFLPVP